MLPIPSEFNLFGVYLSPLLVASVLAFILTTITAKALNRFRLSRFIAHPALAFISIVAIYTTIIGTFLVPV